MALVDDTDSAVFALDASGHIHYANEPAARLLQSTREGLRAKGFQDYFESAFANERLGFIRRVIESGQPLMVEGIIKGTWCRTSLRPLSGPDGKQMVLMVNTPGPMSAGEGSGTARAKIDDLGTLSSLTNRELQILQLIGDGLSTQEIADKLHRSVKTIEWHRVSLGSKLKVTNRVSLARIAIMAGLSRLSAPRSAVA
jgi:DNA-binding CsgD family transcriptional regulator